MTDVMTRPRSARLVEVPRRALVEPAQPGPIEERPPSNGVRLVFVPVPDVTAAAAGEHLHGAVCEWLDRGDVSWDHDDVEKPYTVSPITVQDGCPGTLIATFTDEAATVLAAAAARQPRLRLGSQVTRVARPRVISSASWGQLARRRDRAWTVELSTPTVFHSGNRHSPLPTPTLLIRSAREMWDRYSPVPLGKITPEQNKLLWVDDLDLITEPYQLRMGERGDRLFKACLGSLHLRCQDPATSALVSPLLALLPYSHVGAYRRWGMGTVTVIPDRQGRAGS